MKKSKQTQVTVELVGGLGNQLFSLVAGIYIANKLGVELRPLLRKPTALETDHRSSLASFAHDKIHMSRLLAPEALSLKLRFAIRSAVLKCGFSREWVEEHTRLHVAASTGYDSHLDNTKPGDHIVGYFQTYRYLEELRRNEILSDYSLIKESQWFIEQAEIIRKTNPIVVHVRRGDYLEAQNGYIGALSPEDYSRALSAMNVLLGKSRNNRPLWIFSDQPLKVLQEFRDLKDFSGARFVYPPPEADPAESLILMSLASSIIISNSTFSWWAAALSDNATVVAPSKWFRKAPDPLDLIPEAWHTATSEFIGGA